MENISEPPRFRVPTLLEIQEPKTFDKDVEASDGFGSRVVVKRLFAELIIPFAGDSTAFQVRPPSQRIHTVLRAALQAGALRHVISMDHKSVDQGATELSAFVRELKGTLEALRLDFKAADDRLRGNITQWLNERRQSRLELEGMSSALASKLKS